MSDLFRPVAQWHRLPLRYRNARRLRTALGWLILTASAALPLGFFVDWRWGGAAATLGLGIAIWQVVRVSRWTRNFGYAERESDLLITKGLWTRDLTAIPYGRMLAVNVNSGPIDRALGLAKVELVTASLQSNAEIPGLDQAEAAALRDRLIAAGEAQALPL